MSQKIYSEIKSFKNEIKYLKHKNQSLKNELKMRHQHAKQSSERQNEQANGATREEHNIEQEPHEKEERIAKIQVKRSKINYGKMFVAANTSSQSNQYENVDFLMNGDESSTSSNEFDDEKKQEPNENTGRDRIAEIDNEDDQEEDSLNERFTATSVTRLPSATTMKTVTIPSFDDHFTENHNSTLFMVESDVQNDFYYFDQSAMSQPYQQTSNHSIQDEPSAHKEPKEANENTKLLQILNERLERTQIEKENIEKQLQTILNELKTYQFDNLQLANKYEQQVKYLNEQLQQFQVPNNFRFTLKQEAVFSIFFLFSKFESMQTKNEYNELKLTQNKAHAELRETL